MFLGVQTVTINISQFDKTLGQNVCADFQPAAEQVMETLNPQKTLLEGTKHNQEERWIWVDWGTWVFQDLPVFFLTATQAQRDHETIHTRNFRVQPQAITGSSIVD